MVHAERIRYLIAEVDKESSSYPFTFRLAHPLQIGSKTYEELTVRRGTIGDLEGIKLSGNGMSFDDMITVAARLCGQLPAVIKKLDPDDGAVLIEHAGLFFQRCLVGGKTR